MKIANYQFGSKGLDFAYTLLVNLLKLFRKTPANYKIQVKLILRQIQITKIELKVLFAKSALKTVLIIASHLRIGEKTASRLQLKKHFPNFYAVKTYKAKYKAIWSITKDISN